MKENISTLCTLSNWQDIIPFTTKDAVGDKMMTEKSNTPHCNTHRKISYIEKSIT